MTAYVKLAPLVAPYVHLENHDELPVEIDDYLCDLDPPLALMWDKLSPEERLFASREIDIYEDPSISEDERYWLHVALKIEQTNSNIQWWQSRPRETAPHGKVQTITDLLSTLKLLEEELAQRKSPPQESKVVHKPLTEAQKHCFTPTIMAAMEQMNEEQTNQHENSPSSQGESFDGR